ncbi:unnamed protein product, partial [Rotaria magnacalcarata]
MMSTNTQQLPLEAIGPVQAQPNQSPY